MRGYFTFEVENDYVKEEAIDFVNILLELSKQTTIPFFIVLTLRTDFIGDCAQFYGLPEAMNNSLYLVPKMNRVQIRSVIEGPAKLFGIKIDNALISKLLNDLVKVKDELPLLQHALMRMCDLEYKINKSGSINLEDYEKISGLGKALSEHADEALSGMSLEEQLTTKKIFQALTAIDENGRKIRRPVLLSELKELTALSKDRILRIIELFIKNNRSFLIINETLNIAVKLSHLGRSKVSHFAGW